MEAQVADKIVFTNLLQETESVLRSHNLSFRNIKFILNERGCIPVATFIEQAKNIEYDAGYGYIYIDPTLRIVGATWWLERVNYDGKESWAFRKKPVKPNILAIDPILYRSGYGWNSYNRE